MTKEIDFLFNFVKLKYKIQFKIVKFYKKVFKLFIVYKKLTFIIILSDILTEVRLFGS